MNQGFYQPGCIALSNQGLLYITDIFNHRIVITKKDGQLQGTTGDSTPFNKPNALLECGIQLNAIILCTLYSIVPALQCREVT